MMDEQTRFWIAQEVADTKYTADVRSLFQHGKHIAGKQPKTLITDGAPTFTKHTRKNFGPQQEQNTFENPHRRSGTQ